MYENEQRNYCCAFTGHRPEKLTIPESEIRRLLEQEIIKAYYDGYRIFISGAAKGTDLWAADIVLDLRKTLTDIILICALPFPPKEKDIITVEQGEYYRITTNANEVVYVCSHYFNGCFQLRNKWMIDRCSRLIAVWSGQPGGTKNAVEYAKRTGVEIVNVLSDRQ